VAVFCSTIGTPEIPGIDGEDTPERALSNNSAPDMVAIMSSSLRAQELITPNRNSTVYARSKSRVPHGFRAVAVPLKTAVFRGTQMRKAARDICANRLYIPDDNIVLQLYDVCDTIRHT
jgi:hypothetical protein